MSREIGSRVGAIASMKDGEARIYGFGVYQGDLVPAAEDKVLLFGEPLTKPNPCILLDSGKRVYGCECWWGSEAAIQNKIKGLIIVNVDIVADRAANG